MTEGKGLPNDASAESAVLGAILHDDEVLDLVSDRLSPGDFFSAWHARVYGAMLRLYAKRSPIDLVTVQDALKEAGEYTDGDLTALAALLGEGSTPRGSARYADIIARHAKRRRLISQSQVTLTKAYDESEDLDILIEDTEKGIMAVSGEAKNDFKPVSVPAKDLMGRVKGKRQGLSGTPTGFRGLDKLLAGLHPSDLVILAARPSVGKTALALDIARNVATAGRAVGIFSLEMSNDQLVERLTATTSGVDLWRLRTGGMTAAEEERVEKATDSLAVLPLFLDDNAASRIADIRAKARRLKHERGDLSLIIIDYLQLIETATKVDNRVQEVSAITRSLKILARDLNVPILALSQLSRGVEMLKPAIPRLAHLRESGSIEQDADVVMFIYRKAADRGFKKEELEAHEKNVADIHVAKHRNGPTGVVSLFFDDAHATFRDLETKHVPLQLVSQEPVADVYMNDDPEE